MNWLALSLYAVTRRESKFNLQLLSQYGSKSNCMSRPVPETQEQVTRTLRNKQKKNQTNKKTKNSGFARSVRAVSVYSVGVPKVS